MSNIYFLYFSKLKSVHLGLAALAILSITSSVFNRFCCFFLHVIGFGKHFIVERNVERNVKFGEKEDEENEDENFQLLYYLSYMI